MKFNQAQASLTRQVENGQVEVEQLQKQLATVSAHNSNLQLQLEEQTVTMQQLINDRAQLQTTAAKSDTEHAAAVKGLLAENEGLRSQLEAQVPQLAELKLHSEQKKNAQESEHASLNKQLVECKQENARLRAQLTGVEQLLRQQASLVESQTEQLLARVMDRLSQYQSKLSRASTNLRLVRASPRSKLATFSSPRPAALLPSFGPLRSLSNSSSSIASAFAACAEGPEG